MEDTELAAIEQRCKDLLEKLDARVLKLQTEDGEYRELLGEYKGFKSLLTFSKKLAVKSETAVPINEPKEQTTPKTEVDTNPTETPEIDEVKKPTT